MCRIGQEIECHGKNLKEAAEKMEKYLRLKGVLLERESINDGRLTARIGYRFEKGREVLYVLISSEKADEVWDLRRKLKSEFVDWGA